MKGTKSAEQYFENLEHWQEELKTLRRIIKQTELEETIKWGGPVYTVGGKNVVGLGAFKSYFGIWFFQGVFLKDPADKLVNAGEGRTRGLRQWRMNSADEIDEKLILTYLEEASENQKRGKQIRPERGKPLVIPPELAGKFGEDPRIKKSFDKFRPSKQREFAAYIAEAKKDETKQKRIARIIPLILGNVGLHDKYKR